MERRQKSIALSIVVFAVLFGAIAPVQAVPYVVLGQVFDTDGVATVDGVSVTVTCVETTESLSTTTASGGWYSVTLGNEPNPAPSEGDTLQISADAGDGRTNSTEVKATGTTPQIVNLILQAGPSVESVSPIDGATGVPVNTTISATFSKAMNTTSAESAFSIAPTVAGTFSWVGNTMTFTPSTTLAYNTAYTATITTAAKDSGGNPLASDYTWSFTTEEDTIPPVIHSVTLNPTVVSPGGSILVTVNATDNDAVKAVAVAGGATPPAYVTLTQSVTNPDIWEGSITAKSVVGIYPVTVYAQDLSGNIASDVSQSYDVVEEWEFTIGLVTDYNMISAPLNDTSVTNASSLATEIGGNCSAISKWDAENQQYVSYVPGVPLNNFDIAGGEGYFVIMTGSANVTFTGMAWASPITTISLVENYNMISAPLNDTSITNASSLATEIGGNCSAISKWDAENQQYVSYVPGVPLNNFDIAGGEGYFVIMTGTATVTFEGEPWSN